MKKFLTLLSFIVISITQATAATSLNCNKKDTVATHKAIKSYIDKYFSAQFNEIVILHTQCSRNFAKALIHPIKPVTDNATVYLEKKNNQWTVLTLGTAFDVDLLKKIPKELQ